jgi:hypothetical protein
LGEKLVRALGLLAVLAATIFAAEFAPLASEETMRGAAASGPRAFFTWGTRLLAWDAAGGAPAVIRGAGEPFGEGGCAWDVDRDGRTDVIVQEGPGLGKLVWFHAPEWTRREIDSESEFHDCLGATLFGRRGVLVTHRHGQVRFYEPPAGGSQTWSHTEIYSFYTPSNQAGLLVADVDGDGLPDILCGNYWIRSPQRFDLPWRLFAINTYSELPESAMMRMALTPELVVAQGHLANGRLTRFEKPSNPREQWIAQPMDAGLDLRYPHALASLGGGEFVVGENNGRASRVILFSKRGHRVIGTGAPVHTLLPLDGRIIAIGPHGIESYLRK